MHTNRCVLIEISMEIGMINLLIGIIGHCTDQRNLLYSPRQKYALKYKVRYLGPHDTGLGVAFEGDLHDALLTLVEKG